MGLTEEQLQALRDERRSLKKKYLHTVLPDKAVKRIRDINRTIDRDKKAKSKA